MVIGEMPTIRAILSCNVQMACYSSSSKDIAFWLQKYVLSTRKKTGDRYPPKTLYLLLCGLNRYMKQKLQPIDIFDRGNPDFKLLFNTCDSLFRELREDGVGNDSKPTETLTRDDENKLWSSGVLSASTPLMQSH